LLAGGGCLKGNLYAQVGMLYAAGDTRRTRAYAIHLMALNVGSVLAPLVCGTLGEEVGWHWGFGAAGIGMLAGLAIYVAGTRHLPPDQSRQRAVVVASAGDLPAIIAIGLMLLPYMIVYAAAMQAYNLLLVWAETAMNRDVAGFSVPVTWLLTVDGLLTILGIGLALRLWAWLGPREPGTLAKLAVAGVLVAAAWVILALVTPDAGGAQVPFLAVLGFFFVIDLSYGWLDPPSNAFVSAHAPARLATTLMSLNIAAFGAANILSGWFGRFYEPLGPAGFWWLMAAVALAGTVVALVLRPLVARLMRA
jgi:POT family proton-dependent oligopeptide transporter